MAASGLKVEVTDSDINRYRPTIIIADDNMTGSTGYQRAMWEMTRNNAEGKRITVTVQGWFNLNGELWQPNQLVSIHAPALNIHQQERLIVDCRYTLDEEGTITEMTLIHRDAFNEPAEPIKTAKKSTTDNAQEYTFNVED